MPLARYAAQGEGAIVVKKVWAFALMALWCSATAVVVGVPAEADISVRTVARELLVPLPARTAVVTLPINAQHLALHWAGDPHAQVAVAFSRDGKTFAASTDAGRDEVGEQRADGRTYGALLVAGGARFVRVSSDRPLANLAVLSLADGERVERKAAIGRVAGAAAAQPATIPRSGWGADETLRFDAQGNESWTPTFWPVQKLIVHHTAGSNSDPDPPSTVRAIYYYHAVTQRWGDIGYNFLIDESGRIYKGRHSHGPGSADTIGGEDANGNGVTGAHAFGFNAGTVGVALLGTFTNQDATPAARKALADLLAWKASAHGIDPFGSSIYRSPVTGAQLTFPNIAGHRDVNATDCPGGVFYNNMTLLRAAVALRTVSAGLIKVPQLP